MIYSIACLAITVSLVEHLKNRTVGPQLAERRAPQGSFPGAGYSNRLTAFRLFGGRL